MSMVEPLPPTPFHPQSKSQNNATHYLALLVLLLSFQVQAQQSEKVTGTPKPNPHQISTVQAPVLKQEGGTNQQTEFLQKFMKMEQQLTAHQQTIMKMEQQLTAYQNKFTEMNSKLAETKQQLAESKRKQEEIQRLHQRDVQLLKTEIKEASDKIRGSLVMLKVKLKLRIPDLD